MQRVNSKGGVNKVILLGRIIEGPQLEPRNADKWVRFVLKTTETFVSIKRETQYEEFHNVKFDISNILLKNLDLKKNDLIYMQGKVHTNSFLDENKHRHYRAEIIANNIEYFNS